MAVAKNMTLASFVASEDLTACQYEAVKMTTSSQISAVGSAAETCIGILQNKPYTGEEASVCIGGICPAKVKESSLSAGDLLSCTATGELEQCDAAGDYCIAQLLLASSSTAGTTAEVLPVLIIHAEANASDA